MPFKHHARICRDEAGLIAAGIACISEGLDEGGVVVIAPYKHLDAFEAAIPGINAARRAARYVQYDADEMLRHFMVDDLPDPIRFRECVEGLLQFIEEPRVRVFGEMAGLLSARQQMRPAHLVEQMWNQFGPIWGEKIDLLVVHPYQLSTFRDVNEIADMTSQHAACG